MPIGALLVVEPDGATAKMLAQLCRRIRRTIVCTTAREVSDVIARDVPLAGVILEVDLPDGSGLDVLRDIRRRWPVLPVLVLTAITAPDVINRAHALRAELHAKPTRRRALHGFLHRAVAFERVPDQRVAWLVDEVARTHRLSPREADVLAAAVAGAPRKQLAEELGTTENTLKSLVKVVLRKCGRTSLEEIGRELLAEALAGSQTAARDEVPRESAPPSGPPSIPAPSSSRAAQPSPPGPDPQSAPPESAAAEGAHGERARRGLALTSSQTRMRRAEEPEGDREKGPRSGSR